MTRRFQTLLLAGAVLLVLCSAADAAAKAAAKSAKSAPGPGLGPEESIELPAGDWVEVLPFVIPARDGLFKSGQEEWKRRGSNIITVPRGYGASVLTIPVVPRGSYQLEVKFVTASANGYVHIFLPAGKGSTALVLCDKASRAAYTTKPDEDVYGFSGLEAIDGKNAHANGTGRKLTLPAKKIYVAEVTVKRDDDKGRVTITATLNGKRVVRWSGKQEVLLAARQRHRRHLGLAVKEMPVSFASVRLKMLSGKAHAELPEKQKPPGKPTGLRFKIRRVAP